MLTPIQVDLLTLLIGMAVLGWWLSRFRLVKLVWRILRRTLLLPYTTLRWVGRHRHKAKFVLMGVSVIVIWIAPRPEIVVGRTLVLGSLWGLWMYWKYRVQQEKGKQRKIAHRLPRRRETYVSRYRQTSGAGEPAADQGTDHASDRSPPAPEDLEGEAGLERLPDPRGLHA